MPEWKEEIRQRLAGSRLEPMREAEIVEELSQHLEDRYAELLAGGATPDEASRAALAELSDSELLARELRRVERQIAPESIELGVLGTNRRSIMIAELWQDLRYGARMLLKQPGFTLIAVLTLALGIGANTAIFSVVRSVLLRPLPFHKPERLIGIRESKVGEGHGNPLAWRSFFAFRDQAQTLEAVAAYINWNPDVEREDGTVRVIGAQVSHSYFKVMGVRPLLGRDFTPEDNQPDAPPTVMFSYELRRKTIRGGRCA